MNAGDHDCAFIWSPELGQKTTRGAEERGEKRQHLFLADMKRVCDEHRRAVAATTRVGGATQSQARNGVARLQLRHSNVTNLHVCACLHTHNEGAGTCLEVIQSALCP